VLSILAERVGCAWHTAKRYVTEYATVAQAWEAERRKINDKALHHIIRAVIEGDLQMCKWFLATREPEFMPKQRTEVTGAGGEPIELYWPDELATPEDD
jgi:hypothetical protein